MINIPNHFYPINFRYEAFFSHPYLHRFFEIAGLVMPRYRSILFHKRTVLEISNL
jgi:hypothetical protein